MGSLNLLKSTLLFLLFFLEYPGVVTLQKRVLIPNLSTMSHITGLPPVPIIHFSAVDISADMPPTDKKNSGSLLASPLIDELHSGRVY